MDPLSLPWQGSVLPVNYARAVPRTILYSTILDRLNDTTNETETLALQLQLLNNHLGSDNLTSDISKIRLQTS